MSARKRAYKQATNSPMMWEVSVTGTKRQNGSLFKTQAPVAAPETHMKQSERLVQGYSDRLALPAQALQSTLAVTSSHHDDVEAPTSLGALCRRRLK